MMASMRKRGLRHYIYSLQVFLGPSPSDVDIQFHASHIYLKVLIGTGGQKAIIWNR